MAPPRDKRGLVNIKSTLGVLRDAMKRHIEAAQARGDDDYMEYLDDADGALGEAEDYIDKALAVDE